jgi:hypothetical protein
MKKADLAELARLGVRTKLDAIQAYLADVFDDFPEAFTTSTPPVFLRPQEKPGGNSWPSNSPLISRNGDGADAVLVPSPKHRASWTPERRAAQAERVKQQNAKRSGKWGDLGWHRIYDLLKKTPKRTLSITAITKHTGITGTSIASVFNAHPDLFKKVGRGHYQLTRILKPSERIVTPQSSHKGKANGGSKPKTERKWGNYVWQRLYDYLMTVENRTAPLAEMMKHSKANSAATAITSMDSHKELFKRVSPGVYTLTKELTDEQRR